MSRLILTTDDLGPWPLRQADRADVVIPFGFRFVWGQLPSDAKIAKLLEARSKKHRSHGSHWLDFLPVWHRRKLEGNHLGLIDFCDQFKTIELWINPDSNSQLTLIWLLDTLRPHAKIVSKLALVQANVRISSCKPEELARWRLPAIEIRNEHLETARAAWQAYRAPTPQGWFNLLDEDIDALPQLRQAVLELLEELPMDATGLGATEMRMLDILSSDKVVGPYEVMPYNYTQGRNHRHVFQYWEIGSLLDGLALSPAPAVSGLNGGPFTLEMHDDRRRHARYKRSRLKLTELGKAISLRTDDFSRHNPIHRWWGGTELTNDRLWRWDPVHRELIAP
jgi:hypothetical protein